MKNNILTPEDHKLLRSLITERLGALPQLNEESLKKLIVEVLDEIKNSQQELINKSGHQNHTLFFLKSDSRKSISIEDEIIKHITQILDPGIPEINNTPKKKK